MSKRPVRRNLGVKEPGKTGRQVRTFPVTAEQRHRTGIKQPTARRRTTEPRQIPAPAAAEVHEKASAAGMGTADTEQTAATESRISNPGETAAERAQNAAIRLRGPRIRMSSSAARSRRTRSGSRMSWARSARWSCAARSWPMTAGISEMTRPSSSFH